MPGVGLEPTTHKLTQKQIRRKAAYYHRFIDSSTMKPFETFIRSLLHTSFERFLFTEDLYIN